MQPSKDQQEFRRNSAGKHVQDTENGSVKLKGGWAELTASEHTSSRRRGRALQNPSGSAFPSVSMSSDVPSSLWEDDIESLFPARRRRRRAQLMRRTIASGVVLCAAGALLGAYLKNLLPDVRVRTSARGLHIDAVLPGESTPSARRR